MHECFSIFPSKPTIEDKTFEDKSYFIADCRQQPLEGMWGRYLFYFCILFIHLFISIFHYFGGTPPGKRQVPEPPVFYLFSPGGPPLGFCIDALVFYFYYLI